jgi:hypothetical protein
MAYKTELKKGIKVEKEHRHTIAYIQKMVKAKIFPSRELIYSKIAQDHLKEDPNYYEKLKKAGL